MTLSDPRGGVLTPTDPRTAANKGVFVRGGFGRTPPETGVKTPGHNPLGHDITPFSAAVGHRRTEPGGYFC